MFDRIRKAFSLDAAHGPAADETQVPSMRVADGPLSEWAATQGFGFSADATGSSLALEGKLRGKRWRMEVGKPAREFIRGKELRARAQLGIDENLAVLVMNRPLRDSLEKKAFHIYTDPLQTSLDSNLPEEMRWLAMFDELAWDSLSEDFWSRYSVLSDNREAALAWIDPQLAQVLLDWPDPAPSARGSVHDPAAARQGLPAHGVHAGQHGDAAARGRDFHQGLRVRIERFPGRRGLKHGLSAWTAPRRRGRRTCPVPTWRWRRGALRPDRRQSAGYAHWQKHGPAGSRR